MRLLLLGFCLLTACCSANDSFSSHCHAELAVGRRALRRAARLNSAEASEEARSRFHEALHSLRTIVGEQSSDQSQDDDVTPTTQICPAPNNTMFTTKPTRPPTTPPPATSPPTTAEVETTPVASTAQHTTPTTTVGPFKQEKRENEEEEEEEDDDSSVFRPPFFYVQDEETDPFASYMNTLYNYISSPAEVCDGPSFKDFNSVSEHQLFGFFSTLAVTQPGPFCSICDRLVTELRERLLSPSVILHTPEEREMLRLLYSQVPSSKALCSSIAPGCHDNYAAKVKNISTAVVCLECSGCMSITNVIQHKLLLQPAVVQSFLRFLQSSLFHNICAELCPIFTQPNKNFTIFPHGFSYDRCQNWFASKYDWFIRVATVITRPERLCMLELGWCELNEAPNMLHCLRELCEESLRDTPQTRWICSQIPDSPQQADEFLNIRQSKIYKEKKEYHRKAEQKNTHDEL